MHPEAPAREQYTAISIGQFASLGAARSEVSTFLYVMGATAIGTIDGKTVLFFAVGDADGASLQPLAQFGFDIKPGQCCR